MTTAELIEKLERAEGPSRELFEAAWVAIHHEGYGPENERDTCRLCERFNRMLDAEAWESAALTLVPEGWRPYSADMSVKGRTMFLIEGPKAQWSTDEDGEKCAGNDWYSQGIAATPAIALCIAALKAKEADNG